MTSETRSAGRRISFGILWAIVFYFFTNTIIGGAIGFFAGRGTTSFEAGALAGRQAAADFFNDNRWIILGVQISIFAILCYYGLFPGVAKNKRHVAPPSSNPPPPEFYDLEPDSTSPQDKESR